jgi:hypothetical protein
MEKNNLSACTISFFTSLMCPSLIFVVKAGANPSRTILIVCSYGLFTNTLAYCVKNVLQKLVKVDPVQDEVHH